MFSSKIKRAVAVMLTLLMTVSLAACGNNDGGANGLSDTLINLAKYTGSVSVQDKDGNDETLTNKMKLVDGNAVATELSSYAYISLGNVRVVKLDETARVSISKTGDDKKLTINLEYGRIFFDISNPLAEDEELTIKTPTIVAGIRGTSGEVSALDGGDYIRLFSGSAEIDTADGEYYEIRDHQQVSTFTNDKGGVTSEKTTFTEADIPAFIAVEAEENANGFAETLAANGFDLALIRQEESAEEQDATAADYVSAYKQVLLDNREAILGMGPYGRREYLFADGNVNVADINADGIPELLFTLSRADPEGITPGADLHIYSYINGSAVRIFTMEWVRSESDGDPQAEVLLAPDGTVMTTITGDTMHGDQGNTYTTYEFDSAGMLVPRDSITIRGYNSWEPELEVLTYYRNDEVISESEYNQLLTAYTNSDNELILFSNQYYWDDNGPQTKSFIMSYDQATAYLDSLGS